MLKAGHIIDDKYTIIQQVGSGGMSNIYLARNVIANKNWAIKECKTFMNEKKQRVAKQSLITEANTLKQLKHKYLPSIVDIYNDANGLLLVMDYIEGNTLEYYVKKNGSLPEELVIKWGLELCEVLAYLHSQNPPIVYRDMKPENVMVRSDSENFTEGHICLIDFGISREFEDEKSKDTTLLGTRGFASPEQTSSKAQTDIRSDIYSLGATLYYLVTQHDPNEPPFMEKSILEYNPSLSVGLDNVIRKCISQNPDERYQNCKELHYALSHYQEQNQKYRSDMIKKTVGAGVLALFFLVSSAVSGFGYYMEHKLINSSYAAYIENAVISKDESDRFSSYEKAIEIQPENSESYLAIYNTIMEDGILSTSEDAYLRNLFLQTIDNKTLEQHLATNEQSYSDMAYDLAMAYWYYYGTVDDNGNFTSSRDYQLACRWFSKVSLYDKSSEECQRKYDTAQIYGKIGNYYSQIGAINMAGDNEIKYSDYLNDLIGVFDIECTNVYTRLYLDKDILSQIIEHSVDYKAEGIEQKTLEELVEKVSDEVHTLSMDNANEYYAQILGDAIASIELARTSIRNAYSYSGGC